MKMRRMSCTRWMMDEKADSLHTHISKLGDYGLGRRLLWMYILTYLLTYLLLHHLSNALLLSVSASQNYLLLFDNACHSC